VFDAETKTRRRLGAVARGDRARVRRRRRARAWLSSGAGQAEGASTTAVASTITPTSGATGNCPAGSVSTDPLADPGGRIDPGGTRTYGRARWSSGRRLY
jgi:hypothetical protein